MAVALKSVTLLELAVRLHVPAISKCLDSGSLCTLPVFDDCTLPRQGKKGKFTYDQTYTYADHEVADLPGTAYATLAAALPNLQQLSLTGHCRGAMLGAFGSYCPQLAHLEVRIIAVPVETLRGIHNFLPSLSHLTLTSHVDSPKPIVQAYVDAVCLLLRDCRNLQILQLRLQPPVDDEVTSDGQDLVIDLSPIAWDHLPPCLVDLRCDVDFHFPLEAAEFIARVRCLTLWKTPGIGWNLQEILERAPLLATLTLSCPKAVLIVWASALHAEGRLVQLKAHLLRGFQISCPGVMFSGPSDEIRDLMVCLSPLRETTSCTIQFPEAAHSHNSLDQLARAIPSLVRLSIWEVASWDMPDAAMTDEAFFKPLEACCCLRTVDAFVSVSHTSAGLVSLCASLPSLTGMYCLVGSDESCFASVMTAFKSSGRNIIVTGMRREDYPVNYLDNQDGDDDHNEHAH